MFFATRRQEPCAALSNGMSPCTSEHLELQVACLICADKARAKRARRQRLYRTLRRFFSLLLS